MIRRVATGALALALVAGCGGGARGDRLADGRYFGYIRAVDPSASPPTISIDTADFLTGERAQRAAEAAGATAAGEPVPNDYFVRNEDVTVTLLPVEGDVRVTHIRCAPTCREKIPGRFDAFAVSFRGSTTRSLAAEYRGPHSQYWILVERGEVTMIDEQYLP